MGFTPSQKKELIENIAGKACFTIGFCLFLYYICNPAQVRLAKAALKAGKEVTMEPAK